MLLPIIAIVAALSGPMQAFAAENSQAVLGVVTRAPALSGVQLNPQDVVPEVVALGIQPIILKVKTPKVAKLSYPEDQYVLQIVIGKVSAHQFAQLKALYGNTSQVAYSASRSYDLIDFLQFGGL